MSTLTGALAVGLALTAEEVIVTSKGGPSAVSGAFGLLARAVDRIADPGVPAIPNLADKKSTGSSGKASTGSSTPSAYRRGGGKGEPGHYTLNNPAPGH
jgi:hypothetical protein